MAFPPAKKGAAKKVAAKKAVPVKKGAAAKKGSKKAVPPFMKKGK